MKSTNHINHRSCFWTVLLLLALILAACGGEEEATEAPQATAPAAEPAVTEAAAQATLPPPPTQVEVPATETSLPEAPEETPTAEAADDPGQDEATEAAPTAEAAEAADPLSLAPGQQQTETLNGEEFDVYSFQAVQFQPVAVFVEGGSALDLSLAFYQGTVAADADLAALEPGSQADFAAAGGAELLVFSPQSSGEYSLVVANGTGESGTYIVYMYDGQSEAPGAQLYTDSLAGVAVNEYEVTSNGGRPVLVFVDQQDQSDLIIQVVGPDGAVVNGANFGGGGLAEGLFMLPIELTEYTVQVYELNGASAEYNLVIVALQ